MSNSKTFNFYCYLVKRLFHSDGFECVELFAKDDYNIQSLSKTVNIMTKFGYATIKRIKTKHVTTSSGAGIIPCLVVILKKSEDFEKHYLDYKEAVEKRLVAELASKEVRDSECGDNDDCSEQENGKSSPAYVGVEARVLEVVEDPVDCKPASEVCTLTEIEEEEKEASPAKKSRQIRESLEKALKLCDDDGDNYDEKWWLQGVDRSKLSKEELEYEPEVYM